jgi:hypothetical protein
MTQRKWFWAFFGAALLWFVIGARMVPYKVGNSDPRFPQRIHEGLSMIVSNALWPVRAPATWAQLQVSRMAPADDNRGVETNEELATKLAIARRLLDQAIKDRDKAQQDLATYKGVSEISKSHIQPDDLLPARIEGVADSSSAADTCTINQGASSGVKVGMPVLCNLAVVGRVIQVFPTKSVVVFVTDPREKINAELRRWKDDGNELIADCQVRGEGFGALRCDNIGKTFTSAAGQTRVNVVPGKGDRFLLKDNNWPAAAQGFEFGVVTEAPLQPDMYYRIKAVASEGLRPQASSSDPLIGSFGGLRVLKFDK